MGGSITSMDKAKQKAEDGKEGWRRTERKTEEAQRAYGGCQET
jgi:hypothetical protein